VKPLPTPEREASRQIWRLLQARPEFAAQLKEALQEDYEEIIDEWTGVIESAVKFRKEKDQWEMDTAGTP